MSAAFACIVEGHGECEAVPVLIRRIAEKLDPALQVWMPKPIRIPRSKIIKPNEIERAVELAARKMGGKGAILIVLDSDDDCPAKVGPELLKRAQAARSDRPIAVVLAKREFEAWFLQAAESLRGKRGLLETLSAPPDPESVRGAKEWLSARMQPGRTYSETIDQPALAAHFEIEAARQADSFDKCYREAVRLLTDLKGSN